MSADNPHEIMALPVSQRGENAPPAASKAEPVFRGQLNRSSHPNRPVPWWLHAEKFLLRRRHGKPATASVQAQSTAHPDHIAGRWSEVLATLTAIFFVLIFCWQWLGGTSLTWYGGTPKAGDLAQHYVAGLMWNEHRSGDLYRNFEFSQRLIRWQEAQPIQEKHRARFRAFNYVYSPLMARIASGFSHWSFAAWIRAWFALMVITTALAWLLMSTTIMGLRPSRPGDWFLLLSFPGVWYALIPYQNSTVTLFLVSAASALSTRGFPFGAGAVAACAFYKPQFVLGLGLIMLAAGQYRFIVGLAAGSSLWLAVQLQACGVGPHAEWMQSLGMSLGGRQFQWVGLNQSWRGWFLSLPGLTGHFADGIAFAASAALMGAAGLWLRKLERRRLWQPGYHVLTASALWTVVSPYTAFYDFLLALGLWALCCRNLPHTNANLGTCFLGWIASLVCAAGAYRFPWLAAPLVTLWIFLTIKRISDSTETARPIAEVL